jgi:hypothetical protein
MPMSMIEIDIDFEIYISAERAMYFCQALKPFSEASAIKAPDDIGDVTSLQGALLSFLKEASLGHHLIHLAG